MRFALTCICGAGIACDVVSTEGPEWNNFTWGQVHAFTERHKDCKAREYPAPPPLPTPAEMIREIRKAIQGDDEGWKGGGADA